MKIIMLILATCLSLVAIASDETKSACSAKTHVCASYESDQEFTSEQEGRFKLILKGASVELNKVDLWMQMGPHGHGSSPLKVTQLAPQEFDVTKAYFVMMGTWQIRVEYKQGAEVETLVIPVLVKQ